MPLPVSEASDARRMLVVARAWIDKNPWTLRERLSRDEEDEARRKLRPRLKTATRRLVMLARLVSKDDECGADVASALRVATSAVRKLHQTLLFPRRTDVMGLAYQDAVSDGDWERQLEYLRPRVLGFRADASWETFLALRPLLLEYLAVKHPMETTMGIGPHPCSWMLDHATRASTAHNWVDRRRKIHLLAKEVARKALIKRDRLDDDDSVGAADDVEGEAEDLAQMVAAAASV